MRRTNIYLTSLQEDGIGRLSAATGQSMAALVRSAVNYMLAYPERFPDLHAITAQPARPEKKLAPKVAPVRKAPAKVKRTPARTRP